MGTAKHHKFLRLIHMQLMAKKTENILHGNELDLIVLQYLSSEHSCSLGLQDAVILQLFFR